jgi:hypothetical protein
MRAALLGLTSSKAPLVDNPSVQRLIYKSRPAAAHDESQVTQTDGGPIADVARMYREVLTTGH